MDNTNKRQCVLWTPRWSVDEKNDRSFFFDYFDTLIEYFINHTEMRLIIRPHPLMFKNFIDMGILTTEKYNQIINRVNDIHNIDWDKNYNYLESFSKADILISDFSTLVIEYFITNKPIIYCGGNVNTFNDIGKKMAEGLYHVSNKEELINEIEYLSNNFDIYFEKNKGFINSNLKVKNNIGTEIKEAIVDTYLCS